jgi:hypothetical protein
MVLICISFWGLIGMKPTAADCLEEALGLSIERVESVYSDAATKRNDVLNMLDQSIKKINFSDTNGDMLDASDILSRVSMITTYNRLLESQEKIALGVAKLHMSRKDNATAKDTNTIIAELLKKVVPLRGDMVQPVVDFAEIDSALSADQENANVLASELRADPSDLSD